jgi:hypothetical protein
MLAHAVSQTPELRPFNLHRTLRFLCLGSASSAWCRRTMRFGSRPMMSPRCRCRTGTRLTSDGSVCLWMAIVRGYFQG